MNATFAIFRSKEHVQRFCWGIVFLIFFCCMGGALSQTASAQIISAGTFSCSGGVANGNLFEEDTLNTFGTGGGAIANGDPTRGGGPCANVTGIFGRIMCFFKSTVGQIMSSMYCSFQDALRGPLSAALTLVVVVFGIMIMTGMAHFTVKEVMVTVFKIALIWGFATHAELGIGIAYKLFMGVAETGSNIVLSALATPGGGTVLITQPDTLLLSIFNTTNDVGGGISLAGLSSVPPFCVLMLALLLTMLLFFLPIVAIFIVILFILYIGLYARALLGYLTALVLISFLFILSPLFLGFALFKTTLPLFEQWIKYLITFSLQLVIVFAFLALVQLVPLGSFFTQILGLLREYDITLGKWFIGWPIHVCSICEFGISNSVVAGTSIPVQTIGCPAGAFSPGDILGTDGQTYVIPLWNLLKRQDFMIFIVTQMIALWLIGHVMEDFLKKAPEIAKQLTANMSVAALGGGSATAQGPQVGYIGLESVEAGFVGFKNKFMAKPFDTNWSRRIVDGATGGLHGFLHGAEDRTSTQALEKEAQIKRAERRVLAMDAKRREADRLLENNKDAMAQALQDVEKLKASQKASQGEIDAALKGLRRAHKAYLAALENQHNRTRIYHEETMAWRALEMQRTQLRGIMGSRVIAEKDENGEKQGKSYIIHQGSIMEGIFGHAKDDEALQELAHDRKEAYERAQYGRLLTESTDNMYYFMKLAPEVSASEELITLQSRMQEASSKLSNLEFQLSVAQHLLTPEEAKQVQSMIAKARSDIGSTKSIQGYDHVIGELDAIQSKLS